MGVATALPERNGMRVLAPVRVAERAALPG
jgi:hypothetical protein